MEEPVAETELSLAEQFSEKDLQALSYRAGEPLLTDEDTAQARQALESVFVLVQHYGSLAWTPAKMPPVARQVLIEAAARLFMNLGGFRSERADAVSLERAEEYAQGAELTDSERRRLEELTGKNLLKGALRSVATTNTAMPVSRSQWGAGAVGWVQETSPLIGRPVPMPYAPGDEAEGTGLGPYKPRVPPGGWWF